MTILDESDQYGSIPGGYTGQTNPSPSSAAATSTGINWGSVGNFFNDLLTTAAQGYATVQGIRANGELARLQAQNTAATSAAQIAQANAQASTGGQLLPGVSNQTLMVAGGALVLGLVALYALRRN